MHIASTPVAQVANAINSSNATVFFIWYVCVCVCVCVGVCVCVVEKKTNNRDEREREREREVESHALREGRRVLYLY